MYVKTYISTPIGWFEISGSELGVRTVHFCEKPGESGIDLPADHPVVACHRQLEEYFSHRREVFDLKFDWSGQPDFQRRVWEELLRIPYGTTVSYSDIAQKIGNPAAVRAVGLANRSNPTAIVVPCHRVIGKGGELRGYFYGLDTKMLLLRHENPVRFAEQGALF